MSIRTGREYAESLRDGRQVLVGGEIVDSVVDHPAFRGCVRTISEIYDMQHRPECADILTLQDSGSDEQISLAYLLPRNIGDLLLRRRMIETISRRHGGLMARLPDYVPMILLGLVDQGTEIGAHDPTWTMRIERYFDHCRNADLCLSHSFADPQVDRSRPSDEMDFLHVVREDREGIVVRGVKTVATLAPMANEYLVLTPPRAGITPEQVLFFSTPIDTSGLRFVCREPFAMSENGDRPLSSRFDEMDAWAIFDDVRIPHERVLLARDIAIVKRTWPFINVWAYYHFLVRLTVKAELFLGVCSLVAEYVGTTQYQNVREQIADVARYLETVKAFLRAAEADAEYTGRGLLRPNRRAIMVGHMYAVENHPRLLQSVRSLAGQSILMTPGPREMRNPEIRSNAEHYLGSEKAPADARSQLFRLAWDLSCSSFSSRQLLFEMFNARDLTKNRLEFVQRYDASNCIEMARELSEMGPRVEWPSSGENEV